MLYARVIHENIDTAKACGGILHHLRYFIGLGHVGTAVKSLDLMVCCGLLLQSRNLGRVTKAIEDNIGALSRERVCDAQSYP